MLRAAVGAERFLLAPRPHQRPRRSVSEICRANRAAEPAAGAQRRLSNAQRCIEDSACGARRGLPAPRPHQRPRRSVSEIYLANRAAEPAAGAQRRLSNAKHCIEDSACGARRGLLAPRPHQRPRRSVSEIYLANRAAEPAAGAQRRLSNAQRCIESSASKARCYVCDKETVSAVSLSHT